MMFQSPRSVGLLCAPPLSGRLVPVEDAQNMTFESCNMLLILANPDNHDSRPQRQLFIIIIKQGRVTYRYVSYLDIASFDVPPCARQTPRHVCLSLHPLPISSNFGSGWRAAGCPIEKQKNLGTWHHTRRPLSCMSHCGRIHLRVSITQNAWLDRFTTCQKD
jgi:hypothetical protein